MPPKKPAVTKPAAKAPAKPGAAKAPVGKGGAAAAKKPVAAPAKPKATGTAKKGAPAKGKETKVEPKAEVKKWTPQDEAARKIQTMVRGRQARKRLEEEKQKKKAYEDEMDRLEKEAFVYLVKLEQEKAEREYQKEQEERRQRQEELKKRKRFLEAAFEGDDDELISILKEVERTNDQLGGPDDEVGRSLRARRIMAMVECEDANENTPLSEASSGGHVSTIRLLVERGADPNSRGQYKRTPLYRAAYAGHLEACQTLLQYGADPRIYADDGQQPEHVASQDAVRDLLSNWDMEETERLLVKLEKEKERRQEQDRKIKEAETLKLEDAIAEIEKDYKAMQKKVEKATCELEKRITEHDTAQAEGFDRPDITLTVIHDAEMDLELSKVELEKLRDKLANAKLELREQKAHVEGDMKGDVAPGLPVLVRELDDVLLRDVGNKIRDSGKWPLIIDPSQQAATFLRYRDTNYLYAGSPAQMEPDKIRLALLGSLRFGKPLVLDMMLVDMFDTCTIRFNEIIPGLMDMIMDRSIMKEENYMKLIRDGDGPQYDRIQFSEARTNNFKFCIMTKNTFPSEDLLEKTYPIKVFLPTN